jgi:hypothetical protein
MVLRGLRALFLRDSDIKARLRGPGPGFLRVLEITTLAGRF